MVIEGATTRQRRTQNLTDAQKRKLWAAIENNKREFQQERPEYAEAVRRLAQEIGFPITANNLEHALEVCDATWRPKSTDGASENYGAAFRKLSNRVAQLERDQEVLLVQQEEMTAEIVRLKSETIPKPT